MKQSRAVVDPVAFIAARRIKTAREQLAELRIGLLLLGEFDGATALEGIDSQLAQALVAVEQQRQATVGVAS